MAYRIQQQQLQLGREYEGPKLLGRKVRQFFMQPLVAATLVGLAGWATYAVFVKPALKR
jgi:hypothetical protein